MKKALVRKIEVHETGNVSNYEVYLPATASANGQRIRKRYKRRFLLVGKPIKHFIREVTEWHPLILTTISAWRTSCVLPPIIQNG